MNHIPYFLFILQVIGIFGSELPIKPCSLFNSECVKTSAQAVLPEFAAGLSDLHIKPLDVMKIVNIKLNIAGLDLNMRNIKIYGLKNSVIDSLSVDKDKHTIDLVYFADVSMKGDYKCKGKLLGLQINGDGLMDININKLKVRMIMPFKIIKNCKGKNVINIKSVTYTFEILGNMHFDLSNLFSGNKKLSDMMLNLINKSWKQVAGMFGASVLKEPVAMAAKAIKKYLRSRPLEEITIA